MKRDSNYFLAKVMAPVDTAEFFEIFWEKKPLHISGHDADHFSNMLTLAQIEMLLSVQDMHFPDVQLTRIDKQISVQEYADARNQDTAVTPEEVAGP